jgi:hypothetical protein
MPSERENYPGTEIFPQWPNFSAKLTRKVCQELATLQSARFQWEKKKLSGKPLSIHCVYTVKKSWGKSLPMCQSSKLNYLEVLILYKKIPDTFED